MKAVPVLICLALALGIEASIFKHADHLIDNLDFLRLKQLRQHRNQPSDNEWYRQHLYHQRPWQHNTHQQEEKHDQERDQPRPSYRQHLEWDQTREPQYKEQSQNSQEQQLQHYEQPSFDMNHHQQLEEEMRKQYPSHKQQQDSQQNQPTQRNVISYSTEGSQSSQESQERSQYNDNAKKNLNDDILMWIPQGSAISLEDQNIANNNVIERKVHMDVSSSNSAQDKEELEKIFSDAQKAMKQQQLSDKEQMQIHQDLEHAKQHNQNTEANATPLAQKHQYPIEEHIVKTDDGYVENIAKTTESVANLDLQTGKVLNEIKLESPSIRDNRKTPKSGSISTMDSHHLDVSSSISTEYKEEPENIFSDAQKAMKQQQQLSDKEQMQIHQDLEHAKQHNQDAEANATPLAQKHQYPTEEHIVETGDGYVEKIAETTNSVANADLHTGKILNEIKLESRWNNRKTPKSDSTSTRDSYHLDVSSIISVHDKEELEKIFSDAQKAMNQLSDREQMQFHQALEHAKQHSQDAEANATQLAQKHQYPIEEHIVKTDDGYVLTLFRINHNIQHKLSHFFKKPVVFLMHGIDGSADDWLLMGPKKSLAYLLCDAGYDVWLGNARGNKYSKKHVGMHPAVSDFWQYSIDEIALHDLPAMIDYALEISKQKKLFYIGHSQGNTVFFALTAARPEYNDKISMMYALSPMAYMINARSPLFRMMSPLSNFHNRLQHQLGNGPFSPNKEFIRAVGGAMLEAQTGCKDVSSNINFVMAGVNISASDVQVISLVMHHLPAGTSSKLIKHYGQAIASQEFRRYDYGPEVNMNVYGKVQPPRYEMEKVRAPVSLYYSEEDWLAHPKDVERLEKELPNVKESHKLSEEHFGNMDFQFSSKAPEMVYKSLMESMQNNH